jgi:hypothetical protein
MRMRNDARLWRRLLRGDYGTRGQTITSVTAPVTVTVFAGEVMLVEFATSGD